MGPDRIDVRTRWRQLARTPFQTPEWYAAAGFADRVRVVAAPDGALVPVWSQDDPEHYYHSPRQILTGRLEDIFFSRSWLDSLGAAGSPWGPVALTVSPYGYRGGVLASAGADLVPLAEAVTQHAVDTGAALIMSHYLFDGIDDAWIRALMSVGAEPLVLGAQCVMDVAWTSSAEYYASLGASRRSVRQRHAQWRRRGHVVAVRPVGEPCDQREADLIVRLFADHARRHGDPAPPARLYRALATGAPGLSRMLMTVRDGGAVRSALAVLVYGDTLYPKFFGSHDPHTDYLPLVYDEVVAMGIAGGYRRVDYGGGAHQAKLFRGARLRYALGALIDDGEPTCALVRLEHARNLSARKLAHFHDLAARWQRDHQPPPVPAVLTHYETKVVT
jgi:Acetyltransferase (GNAT) domain